MASTLNELEVFRPGLGEDPALHGTHAEGNLDASSHERSFYRYAGTKARHPGDADGLSRSRAPAGETY
jgi:hypothetical protein